MKEKKQTKVELKKAKRDCIVKNNYLDCLNCCSSDSCIIRWRLGEIK